MSRVQGYKCEVCGVQERDHSKWLLVSDLPRAHNLDIIQWDEKLAAQPGICHLCCSDHLQVLVGQWMMPDLGIPSQHEESSIDDPSLLHRLLDRTYDLPTDRDGMLAMLDAVEVALNGSNADEEEPAAHFDA